MWTDYSHLTLAHPPHCHADTVSVDTPEQQAMEKAVIWTQAQDHVSSTVLYHTTLDKINWNFGSGPFFDPHLDFFKVVELEISCLGSPSINPELEYVSS